MSLALTFTKAEQDPKEAWEKDCRRNLGRRKKTFQLKVEYQGVEYSRTYACRESYLNQVIDRIYAVAGGGVRKTVALLERWQETGKVS